LSLNNMLCLFFFLSVGDFPVSVARFRVDNHLSCLSLIIDKFAILPGCRMKKLSYKSLYWIIKHVENTNISSITISVPANSWISTKLSTFGFVKNMKKDQSQEAWGIVTMEHLTFQLDPTTNVSNISTYLSNKCS
jgi:hypothetical protein